MAGLSHTESILSWLALREVPGVGPLLFKRLVERFGGPAAVFDAPMAALEEIEGMTGKTAAAIRRHRISEAARAEAARIAESCTRLLPLTDPGYPPLLREIPDPPPYLYVNGNLDPYAPCIAIVGSRKATGYGLAVARQLATDLAGCGITVVSGLALGVDTAAHEGALSGNGKTVAVLGNGLAAPYPPENRQLARRIAQNGAVLSEFPLDAKPLPHHFPVRNRVISGLSLGTLVVEAGLKSGSLITARLAAEQGREVFAVPGSVRSFKSEGTHRLIREGAKLVAEVRDVLEELGPLVTTTDPPPFRADVVGVKAAIPPEEAAVVAVLEPYPIHIDDLVRRLAIPSGQLAGILLNLELKGIARQLPGKRFILADP